MSGRKRIIVGEITEKNLRGDALKEALYRDLNQDEKKANYQNTDVAKHDKDSKKK